MDKDWCCVTPRGIRLTVQVVPNAKKTEVIGIHGDTLKIRLQAQPIEGKANDALIRYLATALNVPRSAITILHGHTSKRKLIEIGDGSLALDTFRCVFVPASV